MKNYIHRNATSKLRHICDNMALNEVNKYTRSFTCNGCTTLISNSKYNLPSWSMISMKNSLNCVYCWNRYFLLPNLSVQNLFASNVR